MTLALALAAALAALAVVFVARPYLREPEAGNDLLDEPGTLERRRLAVAEERDRALAALKELEFDHRTGKVSDDDYRELVGPLRRRAAEALRALEPRAEATAKEPRLRDLGLAVYAGDEAGTGRGRAANRDLDEQIAAKEAEMTQVAEHTHERVEQIHAEAAPAELLEPPAPAPGPPEEPYPPAIPEPYPPPDEGTPPTPTPVPEPYPPPDEADRPG